jgi:methyl-accepting chemotaxis protein
MRFNISVRTALFWMVVISASTMAGLLGLSLYATAQRDANDVKSSLVQSQFDTISQIDQLLLQARRSESDFLLNVDETFSAQNAETLANLTRLISLAQLQTEKTGDGTGAAALIAQLAIAVQQYETSFTSLVESQRRLGLNENDGLQGQLRAAVRGAEDMLSLMPNRADMQAKMLMMRRHEKDFLLRQDPEYLDKLNDRITEFRAFPQWYYASPGQRQGIEGLLKVYQNTFASLVAETMTRNEIIATLSANYSQAEPVLAGIKSKFTTAKKAIQLEVRLANEQNRRTAIISSGASIAVFAILALVFSLMVARPLMAIRTALEKMRQKDYSAALKPSFIRETTTIANAVDMFRNELIAHQTVEAEVAQVIAACAQGDFSRRIDLGEGQENGGLVAGVNAIGEAAQKGIDDALAIIESMSQGDLTQRMSSAHDGVFLRMADGLGSLGDRLSQIIFDLSRTSAKLNDTSDQILNTTNTAARRSQTSAASLEETAAALQQLSSNVQESATSAQSADKLVQGAQQQTAAAEALSKQAGAAIERIRESSAAIAGIVHIIEDVAFQTNLLALNAGVEAARAGDAGRGFAVVASEVRTLAQKVSTSAGEISALVRGSEQHVAEGVELAARSAASLVAIRNAVGDVVEKMSEIAASSESQATGITEINIAVRGLDSDVQSNVALMDTSVAAGESLAHEARQLVEIVSQFKFDAIAQGQAQIFDTAPYDSISAPIAAE